MVRLGQEDLRKIVYGACFLASGGGGATSVGLKLTEYFRVDDATEEPFYEYGPTFQLADLEEIDTSVPGYAVVTGYLGSQQVKTDLRYPHEAWQAVLKAVGERLRLSDPQEIRKHIRYIAPIEIGGGSSVVACLVAAKLGIPVIDGDGAGRAVPALNMTTYAANGANVNPTVLSNDRDYQVVLNLSDGVGSLAARNIEALARPVVGLSQFPGIAGFAMWVMPVAELKQYITIRGGLSKALRVGEKLEALKDQKNRNVEELLEAIGEGTGDYRPFILRKGVLKAAEGVTAGGFDHGTLQIETSTGTLRIVFQNESLLIWEDTVAAPLVMAPDLITYLLDPVNPDADGSQWVYSNGDIINPLTNRLRAELTDAQITVVALHAPRPLRTHADRLAVLRDTLSAEMAPEDLPHSFRSVLENLGYYGKYIPLGGKEDGKG